MVLVSFAAAMLVFASYYFCLYATKKVPTGSEEERWLSVAAWAVLSFVAFKRLLHLANACQELNDAFEEAIEKLIRIEAKDNECAKNVSI